MKNRLAFACLLFCLSASAQNYSLNFNGTSQYLNVTTQSSLNVSSNFTIEAWIYPTGPGSQATEGGMIINKEDTYEIARFANGTIQYALATLGTGDWSWVNTGLVAPLNTWSHIALVKTGVTVVVYLNGSSSISIAGNPLTMTANTRDLRMANRSNAGHFFNGNIDEVRIWNVIRTQSDIKTNMFNRNLANNATGLVAYYRMNENTGTTTASASTNTSGLGATLVASPLWQVSPVQFKGNALAFDGSSSVVNIPDDLTLRLSAAITIEAWVYATKTTGIQNVVAKSSSAINQGYIFPRTDDGWATVTSYLYINGGWRNVTATYPSRNVWHHLAMTYDGINMKLYIDGVLSNTVAQTGLIATNSNPLILGNQGGFSEYFGGSVDEVRIWNVAKTQAQIQANMNKELDPLSQIGLVSYYTFDQGVTTGTNTGLTVLPDQTGNNNGSLANFSLSGGTSNFVAQFSGLSVLPLNWLGFTVQKEGKKAALSWMVSNQQNTASFIVQRSADGIYWNDIGTLAAAGNNPAQQQYSFTDASPLNGLNYYHIKQVDIDGRVSYSKVVLLNFVQPVAIYPNPVTDGVLHVQLQQPTSVSVFNSLGKLVVRKQLAAGTQQLNVSHLTKGVYHVTAGDVTKRIVVQ